MQGSGVELLLHLIRHLLSHSSLVVHVEPVLDDTRGTRLHGLALQLGLEQPLVDGRRVLGSFRRCAAGILLLHLVGHCHSVFDWEVLLVPLFSHGRGVLQLVMNVVLSKSEVVHRQRVFILTFARFGQMHLSVSVVGLVHFVAQDGGDSGQPFIKVAEGLR